MSKKGGIWAVGLSMSAVLNWCKKTAGSWRFGSRCADQLRMVGRQNPFEVERVLNVSRPLHVDFAGKHVELREFTNVLSIGDRIRVLCDDGVLVAEKVSETQFKLIHAEPMTELVH